MKRRERARKGLRLPTSGDSRFGISSAGGGGGLQTRSIDEGCLLTTYYQVLDTIVRKSHTTRRRGHLRVAISTVSDPSGSGRVDMLTGPVAAARAVVATGAWATSKHDMYLIRGSVGA